MMRYYVEPSRLLSADDNAAALVDTAHSVCMSVLRQLASLALVSSAMFEELGELTVDLSRRTATLTGKVNRLRETARAQSVSQDEVLIDDMGMLQPFKSSKLNHAALSKRPPCLIQMYEACESIPALERLNQFRSDKKDCRKLYTDPNFFFELWSQQMVEESERKRPARKKQKKNQAAPQVRQPANRIEELKKKTNEYDITIGTSKPSNQISPIRTNSTNQGPASPKPLPESPQPMKIDFIGSPTNVDSGFQSPDSANDEEEPISPLPPAPPPIMRGHSQTKNRGQSIYSVADFDRNSMWMPPPPPPLSVNHSGSGNAIVSVIEESETELPPAPPFAPVPPPPPPPPPADVSGFVAKKETTGEIKSGSGLKRKESRTDLLHSIRTGIQLRKVAERAVDTADGGAQKSGGGAGGGVFNVQAIMEMRRRAFEDEDEEEEDEDGGDWEN